MFRGSLLRLRTSVVVVLALLFSQLALAAYVCPTGADTQPTMMEMAPGEPCRGMAQDEDQPALCHQHCTGAPEATDLVKLPSLGLPAVVHVVAWVAPLEAASATLGRAPLFQPQPPPEPLFLATLRLRV
ncbi:hypothetical protein [Ramlibacter sp.]|uniref:hypothetical protein n=1 Tax=Ramlibacter sp. TaxID=1917967 RepID=UPI0035B32EAB